MSRLILIKDRVRRQLPVDFRDTCCFNSRGSVLWLTIRSIALELRIRAALYLAAMTQSRPLRCCLGCNPEKMISARKNRSTSNEYTRCFLQFGHFLSPLIIDVGHVIDIHERDPSG